MLNLVSAIKRGLSDKKRSNTWLLIVFALIVAGALSSYLLVNRATSKSPEWCKNNFAKEQRAVSDMNWNNAKNVSVDQLTECQDHITKQQMVIVYHDVALSSYMLGDKIAAKQYATNGLDANQKLDDKQRSKIEDQAAIAVTLSDIKSGTYSSPPTFQIIKAKNVAN